MTTFLNGTLSDFKERWREIDKLLSLAKAARGTDEETHDVLCRSAAVLTCAHLEGFLSDMTKSLVKDMNLNVGFGDLPSVVKRTFCNRFVSAEGAGGNERTEELIDVLSAASAKLTPDAFLVRRKDNTSKNPKPKVIQALCANFGVRKPFVRLSDSDLDVFFESGVFSQGPKSLAERLAKHANEGTGTFPYELKPELFGFDAPDESPPRRTLVEERIDEIMNRRHAIAHGHSSRNDTTVEELAWANVFILCLEMSTVVLVGARVSSG